METNKRWMLVFALGFSLSLGMLLYPISLVPPVAWLSALMAFHILFVLSISSGEHNCNSEFINRKIDIK